MLSVIPIRETSYPRPGVGAIDALANKFATGNYWPAPKNPGGGFNFNTTVTAHHDFQRVGNSH